MPLGCDGTCNDQFITRFLPSPRVKKWKSFNICRSYGQLSRGSFLWNIVYRLESITGCILPKANAKIAAYTAMQRHWLHYESQCLWLFVSGHSHLGPQRGNRQDSHIIDPKTFACVPDGILPHVIGRHQTRSDNKYFTQKHTPVLHGLPEQIPSL